MHEAIVTRIKVTPHPDPEVHSLAVGWVLGETIVVSNKTADGELGLYFPCDLQLSEEFAAANDLVRRKNPDGTNAGGMFDENRKVRAQKVRGLKSNGFWCPLSHLNYAGDTSSLKEGDKIATFNGKEICKKYFSPRTLRARSNNSTKVCRESIWFPKHKDTEQLRHSLASIKAGDNLVITLKMHGTSQRVAKNYEEKPEKWYDRVLEFFKIKRDRKVMRLYNGTRNVTLRGDDTGYYSESFREKVAEKLYPYLEDHMEIFFEVVGFEYGKPIMPVQYTSKTKDKEVKKLYGDKITYTYNCDARKCDETGFPVLDFDIYVYRIAYVLPNGEAIDLTWDQVKSKCDSWGVKYVPEISRLTFDGDYDKLLEVVDGFTDGPDLVDPRHPREGVCVRVDSSKWKTFKNKSFLFKVLEGIAKEADDYQDMEEVS
jgi:hypothetical protein